MLTITNFLEHTYIIGYLSLGSALILIIYSFYEFTRALKGKRLKDYKKKNSHIHDIYECENSEIISRHLSIAFGEFIHSFYCKECNTELYRQVIW